MKSQTVLCLSILSLVLQGSYSDRRYCGRYLANTVAFECQNAMTKRTAMTEYDIWIPQRTARSARSKREIVEECCYKACSTDELLAYC
ncbi:unnamed protein product [Leptosia nina]|uniref:Insulin-like domain-containing protein n=1 Tax=Leptosia nina TaxID=320188 RepID=A0AAV1JZD9_9NEOP